MKKVTSLVIGFVLLFSFGLGSFASAEDDGEIVYFDPSKEKIDYSQVGPDVVYGDEKSVIQSSSKSSLSRSLLLTEDGGEGEDGGTTEDGGEGEDGGTTEDGEEGTTTDDYELSGEIVEEELQDNPGISVRTTISSLVGRDSKGVFRDPVMYHPAGEVYEVYSHSYYTYSSHSITGYNVGPKTSDKHIVSVARGEKKKSTKTVVVQGSVSISAEGNIPKALAKVIKAGLTGDASGSVSWTTEKGKTYSGPPNSSKYNTRDFYSAVQRDMATTKSKKYDVYNVYNGGKKTGTKTYARGTITTKSVKKPKKISYSKDFNN